MPVKQFSAGCSFAAASIAVETTSTADRSFVAIFRAWSRRSPTIGPSVRGELDQPFGQRPQHRDREAGLGVEDPIEVLPRKRETADGCLGAHARGALVVGQERQLAE